MNPGSLRADCPWSERRAINFMTMCEQADWNALDSVLQGSNNAIRVTQAEQVRASRSFQPQEYGPADRQERRRILRRARPTTQRLAYRVRDTVRQGNDRQIRKAAQKYFRSFDAKYLAYSSAYETMRRHKRPHIGSLAEFARRLIPLKLEFEEAQLLAIIRDWDRPSAGRRRTVRPTMEFGIHHRARQQLVLKLLKICYPNSIRDEQYCRAGQGRDAATTQAISLLRQPDIEFVAECDITNFFPTIGEKNGRFSPAPTLQAQFPMLPRAVIESTMLSSGVLLRGTRGRCGSAVDMEVTNRNTHARTGVPQGSALSSFIAEHIMSDIMSNAETHHYRGTDMVAYVDNIAVFGETADDVNGLITPLAFSAESNPFGSFDLRRSQSTRHKSQGLIYLGYYLRWDDNGNYVKVEVSDRNKTRFQTKMAQSLERCRFSNRASNAFKMRRAEEIGQEIQSWISSFSLVPGIEVVALELFSEVLREAPFPTRSFLEPLLTGLD